MIYPVFSAIFLAHFLDFALIQTLNLPGQARLTHDIFDAYHRRNRSQIIEYYHLFFIFGSLGILGFFVVPSLELRLGPTALSPISMLLRWRPHLYMLAGVIFVY